MSAIGEVILKRVDIQGLIIEDVMKGVIKAKLEEIVKDSSNPYDDAMFGFIYPMLEDAAVKFVEAQLAALKA